MKTRQRIVRFQEPPDCVYKLPHHLFTKGKRMDDVMGLIRRRLNVDLTNSDTRFRAWQRIRVFRQVADECESEGSIEMAETLRRICRKATEVETGEAERLVYLAMIAGPEST